VDYLKIKDIFPMKSNFKNDDEIEVALYFEGLEENKTYSLEYSLFHLNKKIYTKKWVFVQMTKK
jgi:hypothetical protein